MARKISLLGQVIGKKNQRRPFVRNGRIMNFPSSAYMQWEKDALIQLLGQKPVQSYPTALTLAFTMKDNRGRDLDNLTASILDCLQKAGVLANDDWQHVCPITIDCVGVDKSAAGVDIYFDND